MSSGPHRSRRPIRPKQCSLVRGVQVRGVQTSEWTVLLLPYRRVSETAADSSKPSSLFAAYSPRRAECG
jgi:hypothetical protein